MTTATADLILFFGSALTAIVAIAMFGKADNTKAKVAMHCNRKSAQKRATDISVVQARMANSSGVIKRG